MKGAVSQYKKADDETSSAFLAVQQSRKIPLRQERSRSVARNPPATGIRQA